MGCNSYTTARIQVLVEASGRRVSSHNARERLYPAGGILLRLSFNRNEVNKLLVLYPCLNEDQRSRVMRKRVSTTSIIKDCGENRCTVCCFTVKKNRIRIGRTKCAPLADIRHGIPNTRHKSRFGMVQ